MLYGALRKQTNFSLNFVTMYYFLFHNKNDYNTLFLYIKIVNLLLYIKIVNLLLSRNINYLVNVNKKGVIKN